MLTRASLLHSCSCCTDASPSLPSSLLMFRHLRLSKRFYYTGGLIKSRQIPKKHRDLENPTVKLKKISKNSRDKVRLTKNQGQAHRISKNLKKFSKQFNRDRKKSRGQAHEISKNPRVKFARSREIQKISWQIHEIPKISQSISKIAQYAFQNFQKFINILPHRPRNPKILCIFFQKFINTLRPNKKFFYPQIFPHLPSYDGRRRFVFPKFAPSALPPALGSKPRSTIPTHGKKLPKIQLMFLAILIRV